MTIYKNELHTVSGHLSVNWSYLIIETKTEKLGKCLFYGFLLWKLPSVEEMSEERRFSFEYRVYFLVIEPEFLRYEHLNGEHS